MAQLVEGVSAALSVHILPVVLLEDSGGAGDLSDDTEGIFLGVLDHLADAGVVVGEISLQIPECGAEVAIFVVEEK